jgi:8-amino-7-oxononanoate synthase
MLSLKNELEQIVKAGLYRKLVTIGSQSGPKVVVEGREMLMMASNDYLGFCSHPRIKNRAQQALQHWGAGSSASRLISGNMRLFNVLEKNLAHFKETEDALVFSTGYMANIGLLTALGGKEDVIFSDELNHASIIDGCRLSWARTEVYPHRNTDVLESLLIKAMKNRRRIIVTDGIFSMDGDIAPVPALVALSKKYDAILIVDDAHGTGVLGANGRGTMEHFGLIGCDNVIIMGTMGKALGCFGAFVAGSTEVKHYLVNCSRSFIFTTALPPSVIASTMEALQIIKEEPERRYKLQENFSFMRCGLQEMGFITLESETQIIPIMIGDPQTTVAMAGSLIHEGLFIQAIRPPTVPEGSSRLRMTIMATHTKEDLSWALEILEKVGKQYKVIG